MRPSAGAALGTAWRLLRASPGPFFGASGLLFLAAAALNTFDLLLAPLAPPDVGKLVVYFAVAVPWWLLVLVPLMAGLDLMAVRRARGAEVRARDVQGGFERAGRAIGVYALLSVILGLGYVLFVLPGLVLTMSLLFAPLYVLDQDMRVGEALRASMELTRGRMGAVFVFLVAGTGIVILGTLLLVVGLVPAVAWLFLARAELYRQMRGETALTAPAMETA